MAATAMDGDLHQAFIAQSGSNTTLLGNIEFFGCKIEKWLGHDKNLLLTQVGCKRARPHDFCGFKFIWIETHLDRNLFR